MDTDICGWRAQFSLPIKILTDSVCHIIIDWSSIDHLHWQRQCRNDKEHVPDKSKWIKKGKSCCGLCSNVHRYKNKVTYQSRGRLLVLLWFASFLSTDSKAVYVSEQWQSMRISTYMMHLYSISVPQVHDWTVNTKNGSTYVRYCSPARKNNFCLNATRLSNMWQGFSHYDECKEQIYWNGWY